jgi:hypothetical protein
MIILAVTSPKVFKLVMVKQFLSKMKLAIATIFATIFATASAQYCPAICPQTHVIQTGDTLSTIARRYRTSVPHLARVCNWIPDPDSIPAGGDLCVPCPPDCPNLYTVPTGATLGRIAFSRGSTPEIIKTCNPGTITNIDVIMAGQNICIP